MTRRPRALAMAAAVGVLAAMTTGCGNPEERAVERLRAAMDNTRKLPHLFVYEEISDAGRTVVKGIVEDDLRHRARVEIDDQPAYEEVARDDVLAVRFMDPARIPLLLRKTGTTVEGEQPESPPSRTPADEQAIAMLQTTQWVLDSTGTPTLFSDTEEARELGSDPISDGRTVFDYVESVMRQMRVMKFNEDALDYRPDEDPFPKPAKDSGVDRYDFVRTPVPRPSDAASGGNQPVPSERNFRKMAVYVEKGRVTQIREDLDVASRLEDIEENYDVRFTGPTAKRVRDAVDAINGVRRGQGDEKPIRVRKMSFEVREVGVAQVVELPAQFATADVSVLANRGRPKDDVAPDGTNPGEGGA